LDGNIKRIARSKVSNDLGIEIDHDVLLGFIEESRESLATLDSMFVRLENNPEDTDTINAIFRPVHSIKGNAPFFGLMKLKTLAHEVESLLAALRAKKIVGSRALFDILLNGIDEIKAIFERVSQKQAEIENQTSYDEILDKTRKAISNTGQSAKSQHEIINALLTTITNWKLSPEQRETLARFRSELTLPTTSPSGDEAGNPEKKVPENSTNPPKESQTSNIPSAHAPSKTEASKSMRVPEERIDTFLRFVGELIVAQDMLRHFSAKAEHLDIDQSLLADLRTISGLFATLGGGLERAIMSIRKVPVKSLLQKAPRLIRDVATSKGKEIDVTLVGEEIEIDKSLLEILDAPITHMSRNAADHGIESPEQRVKAGKSARGHVLITCEETSKEVIITISDDGAGLNYEGLKKKALSLGIIKENESLSDTDVVDLIFMSGVSTAQAVSDISGRGVGMDVVKRNIESTGGSIQVKNTPGQGCDFILKLPKAVTTQIIQGFIVEASGVHIVLPLENVHESWCLKHSEVVSIADKAPCVSRHDKVLRIVDLSRYLNDSLSVATLEQNAEESDDLIVTIDVAQTDIALKVDKIIGPRQLVVKPLEEIANEKRCFVGGAILGDGNIALVLDTSKLLN
jgi:two-component system chemotaxis sensor kinase CheA